MYLFKTSLVDGDQDDKFLDPFDLIDKADAGIQTVVLYPEGVESRYTQTGADRERVSHGAFRVRELQDIERLQVQDANSA
ncbi:hypothetical protein CY34DRAFT_814334 [Suillus luteus UH-Slu-Lm8-n1]|uniref:Uncharacterized protein n=1 Tax=Suillus luteus UH-Slu-Lm8-n1 TaxID=930992 RepID=A0A0C9ZSZ0_9AGAM|nr:hypothetical protein CY34DRAFT_814334 [Suillus luteus UH-Slu-Lm8-n1]